MGGYLPPFRCIPGSRGMGQFRTKPTFQIVGITRATDACVQMDVVAPAMEAWQQAWVPMCDNSIHGLRGNSWARDFAMGPHHGPRIEFSHIGTPSLAHPDGLRAWGLGLGQGKRGQAVPCSEIGHTANSRDNLG